MADNKKQELRDVAAGQMADPIITLAYIEHQMDLTSQLVIDLASKFDLSPAEAERLEMLKSIMEHSSINFANIQDMLESYKVPKTKEHKKATRTIQIRYLLAQVKAGIFNDQQ